MFHKSKLALGVSSLKNDKLILKNYIKNYPNSPLISDAINHLLNYYNTNGIVKEELNLYNIYLNKFKDDPWFLNQYAWRMTELEINLDTALDQINLSLNIFTGDSKQKAMIIDTKAEIYFKMKLYNDAVITINESIKIDSDNQYYINQKNKFIELIN